MRHLRVIEILEVHRCLAWVPFDLCDRSDHHSLLNYRQCCECLDWRLLVSDKMLLHVGHRHLLSQYKPSERFGLNSCRKECSKHTGGLFRSCISELNSQICSPRTNQRRVELLNMVGRHKSNGAIFRSCSVQRVEQSTKGK